MLDETPDRLGDLAEATAAATADLRNQEAVARLWGTDHTLWRPDPTEIEDRLGWLTVVPEMMAELDNLQAQCDALTVEVDHVLVMGMGGSSLFPEVVASSVGHVNGRPQLHVVDTTDPAAIARVAAELPADRTFHVAASKSGTTLETRSHLEWAWERSGDPTRFGVITDPQSALATLAVERGFAAVWENRPDIGGRYSALSHFGLVPATLAGADVAGMLASASSMAERLRGAAPVNPGARLAAVLAAAVRTGRDKVTLVVPEAIASFGLWLEQLLAESTGKDGTGVVPVVGEPLGPPEVYGQDRLFVAMTSADDQQAQSGPGDATLAACLDELAEAGHPVHVVPCDGLSDLGGQVLLWEVATALCGMLLGIHPFDQPDVAAAKEATNRVLAGGPSGNAQGDAAGESTLSQLLASVKPGDYLGIQAFIDPGSDAVGQLEAARVTLRDRLKVATTLGLGPRYLHSTGQLHKGGPATGVFVQLLAGTDPGMPDEPVVAVPGQAHSFGEIIAAQADGDMLALKDRGRRVARVGLEQLLAEVGRVDRGEVG